MPNSFAAIALCVCAPLAFAQLDANSVTVTASRTIALQPDQAIFQVSVSSGLGTSLTDVVAALPGSGITAANFTGLSTVYTVQTSGPQPQVQWNFVLPVPITAVKDTSTVLTNLMKTISGLTLSFYVQGSGASLQLQQTQPCPLADLIADASAQAQKLAAAAGLGVGAILAMSSSTSTTIGSPVLVAAQVNQASLVCSMTVEFALGRF